MRKRKATFKQPENEQFPGHFPDKGRKKKERAREKRASHSHHEHNEIRTESGKRRERTT